MGQATREVLHRPFEPAGTYQALERAERWFFAAMVRPVLEQIFAPGISIKLLSCNTLDLGTGITLNTIASGIATL
jgi:hypothetical protein